MMDFYWALAALELVLSLFTSSDAPAKSAPQVQPRDQVSGGELVLGEDLARDYCHSKLSPADSASE